MIKYYKINQGQTNENLATIANSIKSTYKTDSIIVADDTSRVYYQSPSTNRPTLIGSSDRYVEINGAAADIMALQPNTNYVQIGACYQYTLPTTSNNCTLKKGDVIRLLNQGSNTNALSFSNTGTAGSVPLEVSKGRQVAFRFTGSSWTPITASIMPGILPSATVQTLADAPSGWGITTLTSVVGLGNVNTFSGYNSSLKTKVKGLSALGVPMPASTAFWYTSAIIEQAVLGVYFDTSDTSKMKIFANYLPSAKADDTWGITTIESGYTKAAISGSDKPMAANAVYKYISGNVESYTSSAISGIRIRKSNGTDYSPVLSASVSGRIANLYNVIQDEYKPSACSGSAKIVSASGLYTYVKDNVETYTSSAVSAITFNLSTHTGTNRVVDIGTMSTRINEKSYSANTSNLIDLGNNYVQVTGTINNGYFVKKTTDGWTTDPGITTLSSNYTSSNLSSTTFSTSSLVVDGKAIPVMIKTGAGNLYPIEKGTLSAAGVNFLIDVRPYLVYDGATTFTGTWTVYYGAGINDIYTTANTIQNIVIGSSDSNKTVYFNSGDVAVITTNSSSPTTITLQIPAYGSGTGQSLNGLPVGHGIVFKIINSGGKTIKFATRTLVSSTGSYSVSFFNFGNGAEQVGEVVHVY